MEETEKAEVFRYLFCFSLHRKAIRAYLWSLPEQNIVVAKG